MGLHGKNHGKFCGICGEKLEGPGRMCKRCRHKATMLRLGCDGGMTHTWGTERDENDEYDD